MRQAAPIQHATTTIAARERLIATGKTYAPQQEYSLCPVGESHLPAVPIHCPLPTANSTIKAMPEIWRRGRAVLRGGGRGVISNTAPQPAFLSTQTGEPASPRLTRMKHSLRLIASGTSNTM